MTEPEDFLTRWSRRKRETNVDSAVPSDRDKPVVPVESKPETQTAPSQSSDAKPEQIFDLSKLPSLDSIGPATDIRIFLQPGVPEALSRAALRRAWSADPGIRDFIGLSENSWDFTATDSIHGFGALDPAEAKQLLAQLLGSFENDGKESSDGSEPANAPSDAELLRPDDPEAISGTVEGTDVVTHEPAATATNDLLQASNSIGDDAAPQKHGADAAPEPVPPRRSHGRALPQ